MTCAACDPVAFRAELVAAYGEPVMVGGTAYYANPDMSELSEPYVLDPAQWSRALCPIHNVAETVSP